MEPGLVLEGHLQMHVFRSAHLGIGHPDFLANTYSRPTRVAHRDDLVAQPNPAASIAYLPGEGISTRQRTGEPARPEPTSLTVPAADSTGATPGLGSSKAARLGAILALQAMTPPAAIAGSGFTLKVTQYTPLTNAGAPLITAVLSIVLLGTSPTATKLAGIALALIAAVFLAIEPEPATVAAKPETR